MSQPHQHPADPSNPPAALPAHLPNPPADSAPKPTRTLALLLVDDNEDTLHVTARILRLLGHQVTTANGAAAALQAAARETFDLVISDMEMPDGNGFDLMRDLVARRFIKGIAVTGYGAPEDIQRAKDAGFQKYLTKPIDIQVLQAAILELT